MTEAPSHLQQTVSAVRSILSGEPIFHADTLAEQAAIYALGGVPVFPCRPRGKPPITENGLHDATVDIEQVKAWWDRVPTANIGLPTGAASGFVCIDVDGERGRQAMQTLLDQQGTVLPETLLARTGGGGWHLIFVLPDGVEVRNSTSKLAPSVDVRGEGGYIIAAPSVHESGQAYRWARNVPPVVLPEWLVTLLGDLWLRALRFDPRHARAEVRPVVLPAPLAGNATPYGQAALDRQVDLVRRAVVGQRRSTLNGASYALGQMPDEINPNYASDVLEIAAHSMAEPLTVAEIRTTIENGIKDGQARPYVKARS